jgi:hypothetical protein
MAGREDVAATEYVWPAALMNKTHYERSSLNAPQSRWEQTSVNRAGADSTLEPTAGNTLLHPGHCRGSSCRELQLKLRALFFAGQVCGHVTSFQDLVTAFRT